MSKTTKAAAPAVAQPFKIQLGQKTIQISREDGICSILLLLLLFLVYTIRLNFLDMPFERDEGIYAYNGLQLLNGKTPYVDFYEQKFPGIFYFYAIMDSLFGASVQGLHRGFIYINLISIIFLYFTVRKLFGSPAAVVGAITFAFVSLTPSISGFTVQSEHAGALFFCLGFLFYAYSEAGSKRLFTFLTGIAFGLSFMVKTSGVFLIAWAGLMVLADQFFSGDRKIMSFIRQGAIYAAGVVAVVACFFLMMMAKGAYDEMMYWTVEVPRKYISKMTFEQGKQLFSYTLTAVLSNHKFFWINAFLACLLLFFKNIPPRIKWFGLSLAAFSFLTIVPGWYFYGHYWILMVPGLSVIGSISAWGITATLRDRFNVKMAILPMLYPTVFTLLTFMHMSKQKGYYFHPNKDLIMRQVYGGNPFLEAAEIGKYINKVAKPEDKLVVIGSEPQIYIYTNKTCPSKHAYFAALVADVPEHREWQREFVKSVEAAAPEYLVFFRHGISLFVQPDTDNYIFEWLNKYVTENYHVVGLADMPDNQMSTYVWGQDVNTYKPVGQNMAYVFEKNKQQPAQSAAATSNNAQ